MFDEIKRDLARRRLQPGDGRALRPFRWWQPTSRALMHLAHEDGHVYTVDVHHLKSDSNGSTLARLYTDGRETARSRMPALFPVAGGGIEVAVSMFGLKRCHFVAADGSERQLEPDPRSGEGRRAQLERSNPGLSRLIGGAAMLVLLVSLGLLLLQLAEQLTGIPPVEQRIGRFESPIALPAAVNIALTLLAALASTERAMRLRYTALLD
ncbi:MAG: hypothetical protein ABW204_02365 [Microbacteriaceae bacterium]